MSECSAVCGMMLVTGMSDVAAVVSGKSGDDKDKEQAYQTLHYALVRLAVVFGSIYAIPV